MLIWQCCARGRGLATPPVSKVKVKEGERGPSPPPPSPPAEREESESSPLTGETRLKCLLCPKKLRLPGVQGTGGGCQAKCGFPAPSSHSGAGDRVNPAVSPWSPPPQSSDQSTLGRLLRVGGQHPEEVTGLGTQMSPCSWGGKGPISSSSSSVTPSLLSRKTAAPTAARRAGPFLPQDSSPPAPPRGQGHFEGSFLPS